MCTCAICRNELFCRSVENEIARSKSFFAFLPPFSFSFLFYVCTVYMYTERCEMNNVYVIHVCVCVCDLILHLNFIMWFFTKTYWPDQRSFHYCCDDEISIVHYYYLVLVSSQPADNLRHAFRTSLEVNFILYASANTQLTGARCSEVWIITMVYSSPLLLLISFFL